MTPPAPPSAREVEPGAPDFVQADDFASAVERLAIDAIAKARRDGAEAALRAAGYYPMIREGFPTMWQHGGPGVVGLICLEVLLAQGGD